MSRTREPWRIYKTVPGEGALVVHDGIEGQRDPSTAIAEFYRPEDAVRSVACVNACAGWTTDELEEWIENKHSPLLANRLRDGDTERDALREQVQVLREALTKIGRNEDTVFLSCAGLPICEAPHHNEDACAVAISRAALAQTAETKGRLR